MRPNRKQENYSARNAPHSDPYAETYYEMAGSGAPVLVLSGTGGDLRKKPTIMDSPLTAGFTVISYDQRGLGQSEKPQDGYTMAAYADDAAALMDALDKKARMFWAYHLAAWWRRNLPSPIVTACNDWRCFAPLRAVRAVRPTRLTNWNIST